MNQLGPDQDWQEVLRSRGHRLTPQRELVLRAVDRLGHATVDDVHREVARQTASVNISTVYRTLTLLTELGLVRQVHLTDRTPMYHTRALPAHVHLTCAECGAVTDADPADFLAMARTLTGRYGFAPDLDRLVLPGRCAACLAGDRS